MDGLATKISYLDVMKLGLAQIERNAKYPWYVAPKKTHEDGHQTWEYYYGEKNDNSNNKRRQNEAHI